MIVDNGDDFLALLVLVAGIAEAIALFWPRCWSRRHGVGSGRGVAPQQDAAHAPQTPARGTQHRPIGQRLWRPSCGEWPVGPAHRSGQASTAIACPYTGAIR